MRWLGLLALSAIPLRAECPPDWVAVVVSAGPALHAVTTHTHIAYHRRSCGGARRHSSSGNGRTRLHVPSEPTPRVHASPLSPRVPSDSYVTLTPCVAPCVALCVTPISPHCLFPLPTLTACPRCLPSFLDQRGRNQAGGPRAGACVQISIPNVRPRKRFPALYTLLAQDLPRAHGYRHHLIVVI
jgi:hypothetical protein